MPMPELHTAPALSRLCGIFTQVSPRGSFAPKNGWIVFLMECLDILYNHSFLSRDCFTWRYKHNHYYVIITQLNVPSCVSQGIHV